MDRRELFKTIAGVAAGAGVVGTVKVAEASVQSKPALVILEVPGHISTQTAARLRDHMDGVLDSTPFAGMKTLVLSDGVRLTMLDSDGRVLNQTLEP
jgi:hypothetical protein